MLKRVLPSSFVILLLALTSCNFPSGAPTVTPTAAFTDTPTAPPPTDTPLPTDTPAPTDTPLPPTATPEPPTPIPPTAVPTHTRVPTQALPTPLPRARFDATFAGGTFVFRISDRSNFVIPKSVIVIDAKCNEGITFSDTVIFSGSPTFPIEDAKFGFNYMDTVLVTGQFFSSTSAQGTITLYLKSGRKNCTLGPLNWKATGG